MAEPKTFDQELEQVLLDLGIPPCPGILLDLAAEARKDEPDLHRIEKLISADVGLSAALIKTINSPFYGLRTKVSSIMQAIHMLGLGHLWLMVMGMVLRDTLKGMNNVDMGRFWDASAKIAIISSYIACRLPYMPQPPQESLRIDKDEAYTYGLFQDCGISILLNHYPAYKETLSNANNALDRKFTDIEEVAHTTNHALVGYLLAKSWGLPENMTQAIRFHHEHEALSKDPEFLTAENRNFIALALLAERVIQVVTGLSRSCEWDKGESWVMRHFGFSHDDFNEIIEGIRVLHDEGNLNS
jgi:HD-like signal output (HDOD) protein